MNNVNGTRSKAPRRVAGFIWLALLSAFFVLLGACGAGNDDEARGGGHRVGAGRDRVVPDDPL